MIQAYDANGRFIKNWRVNAAGGTFHLQLTKDSMIYVETARGDNQLWYDRKGNTIAEQVRHTKYSEVDRPCSRYTTGDGVTYEVKGGLFPRIEKSSPQEEVIVRQGILFHILKGPLPAWLFIALGTGIRFWLNREKENL